MTNGDASLPDDFGAAGAAVPLHGNARILILDDEHAYLSLLEGIVSAYCGTGCSTSVH